MIAVLGSINLDFVALSARLPTPGETIAGSAFKVSPGGKGANQSLASRRGGSDVIMAGAIGNDDHGTAALKNLSDAGVDLSNVTKKSITTGIASIFVSGTGDNMIISVPGANAEVGVADVDELLRKMRSGDWLLLQLEIPGGTVERALSEAKKSGIRTILNTAPFTADAVRLSSLADVVVMNESEMAEAGRSVGADVMDIKALHARLYGDAGRILVITKGRDGAVAFDGNTMVSAPALAITPVDTVGAGDTFVGFLAAGLDNNLPIEQALQRAAAAASFACLKPGAQSGIPQSDDVVRALALQRSNGWL